MSDPAQGWYPDPSGLPRLRWWDGHAWTDYVEPCDTQAPSTSTQVLIPGPQDAADEAHQAADAVPVPAPEATPAHEATPASSAEPANGTEREEAAPSGTLKWALGCAASWILVAVFIVVLVIAWTHLGASGRMHDQAKERADSAQEELDRAQSTLDDINRQIEEAQK